MLKIWRGYTFENTKPGSWYVQSKVYKKTLGPFKTRKHAYEFVLRFES